MVKHFDRNSIEYSVPVMNALTIIDSPLRIRRLRRADLPLDSTELARFLIGKTLVRSLPRGRLSGRIVETESYPVGDPAGHAFRGLTLANRSLFLRRGHAYVHFTYGSCWLMNVSGDAPGIGAGVLIRAFEPLEGIQRMMRHRGVDRLQDVARGPGRLAEALGVDKRFDGIDLCSPGSELWLGAAVKPVGQIGVSVRIGISRAANRKLRFYEPGSPFVSGSLRLRR
ncbi:MAG: DNA-3-methyladenine glycosylase [Candidatus Acidiferrales bacterium]